MVWSRRAGSQSRSRWMTEILFFSGWPQHVWVPLVQAGSCLGWCFWCCMDAPLPSRDNAGARRGRDEQPQTLFSSLSLTADGLERRPAAQLGPPSPVTKEPLMATLLALFQMRSQRKTGAFANVCRDKKPPRVRRHLSRMGRKMSAAVNGAEPEQFMEQDAPSEVE